MATVTQTTLLEEALEAWGDARRGVVAELSNVTARDVDFRPAPGARSVAELVRHVVETALMWSGELTNPKGDFTRKSFPAFIKHYAGQVGRNGTKTQLIHLLKATHRQGARQISDAGEVAMLQQICRFDGVYGTRLTWMHHGIAHEEYHRAQLALYARLMGHTPALTKLIQAG